jgi:hypothetical protein
MEGFQHGEYIFFLERGEYFSTGGELSLGFRV